MSDRVLPDPHLQSIALPGDRHICLQAAPAHDQSLFWATYPLAVERHIFSTTIWSLRQLVRIIKS